MDFDFESSEMRVRQKELKSITVCPRNLDPVHILSVQVVVSYYIKWVKTSWTHSMFAFRIRILQIKHCKNCTGSI